MKRPVLQHRLKGFTLIELMVVVVIIGVMVTLVTWNIGDGGRRQQMEDEARRLSALIKLAQDEAVLMSQELAMVIEDDRYGFQRLVEKTWEPLEGDRVLRERKLEPGLMLQLEMDEFIFVPQRKKTDEEDAADEEEDAPASRVYFLSSGEVTPFTLYIKAEEPPDDERFRVSVDIQAEVKWEGPLSPDEF